MKFINIRDGQGCYFFDGAGRGKEKNLWGGAGQGTPFGSQERKFLTWAVLGLTPAAFRPGAFQLPRVIMWGLSLICCVSHRC